MFWILRKESKVLLFSLVDLNVKKENKKKKIAVAIQVMPLS